MKENPMSEKSNKLESELNRLSKKAESLITPPKLDITNVLSQINGSNISARSFAKIIADLFFGLFSKPALSFAIILLCALSFFYLPGSQRNLVQKSLAPDSLSSEALLAEIDKDLTFAEAMNNLEDYALSGFITSSDNQNNNLDEFIEFVTPTDNETI
ncbi:MAG: hypothetical protein GY707_01685 [Desulfobacteraceae bacterium]|nr:hypothetical protein [Desulfobacteraceae bacterium]